MKDNFYGFAYNSPTGSYVKICRHLTSQHYSNKKGYSWNIAGVLIPYVALDALTTINEYMFGTPIVPKQRRLKDSGGNEETIPHTFSAIYN